MARLASIPEDFGFTEEHELLRQSARRLLEERCPMSEVRRLAEDPLGYDPGLWKEIANLGWVGLALPEALGGAGLGQLHQALLMEEMGRVLLPSPYLGCVLAGWALEQAASAAQAERWGPALASGETLATLALAEADGAFAPEAVRATAEPAEGGFVLRGAKAFVPGGVSARLVLAPFRTSEGVSLFAVEAPVAGLEVTPEIGVDPTRRTARLRFEGVRVPREARLEADGALALAGVHVRGLVALSAEMLGGAESTLRLMRDYAIDRKQFGRQIGAFQAVKYPIVDSMIGVEMARSHVYAAAAALDHSTEPAELRARMAKALVSDVYTDATRRCVQIHGGYGFTIDCDAHFHLKRALWGRAMLGDAVHQRRRLAAALFDKGTR